MPKPRVFAVTILLICSVVLAACGNEDSADPTAEPTATRDAVSPTVMAGTTELAQVSPAATERATSTAGTVATAVLASPDVMPPVQSVTATDVPVAAATPVATAPASAQASPVAASPAAQDVSIPVRATLVLNGTEQVDYVITPDGCVGLGQWRSLKPGAQVIVRDANGTVVDVGTLEAGDDGCSWMADITAPGSEFVSISVPMVTEMWFTQADLESGEIEITLP